MIQCNRNRRVKLYLIWLGIFKKRLDLSQNIADLSICTIEDVSNQENGCVIDVSGHCNR